MYENSCPGTFENWVNPNPRQPCHNVAFAVLYSAHWILTTGPYFCIYASFLTFHPCESHKVLRFCFHSVTGKDHELRVSQQLGGGGANLGQKVHSFSAKGTRPFPVLTRHKIKKLSTVNQSVIKSRCYIILYYTCKFLYISYKRTENLFNQKWREKCFNEKQTNWFWQKLHLGKSIRSVSSRRKLKAKCVSHEN